MFMGSCLFSFSLQGPAAFNPRLDLLISDLFSTKTIKFRVGIIDDLGGHLNLQAQDLIVSCPSTANVATIKTIVANATDLACRGIMHLYKGPYGNPADDSDDACSSFREDDDQYADLSGLMLIQPPHVKEMCVIHFNITSPGTM